MIGQRKEFRLDNRFNEVDDRILTEAVFIAVGHVRLRRLLVSCRLRYAQLLFLDLLLSKYILSLCIAK